MAAKRKIAPPKPEPNRPWHLLTLPERNAAYSRALHAYGQGGGDNPGTRGEFFRAREAERPASP